MVGRKEGRKEGSDVLRSNRKKWNEMCRVRGKEKKKKKKNTHEFKAKDKNCTQEWNEKKSKLFDYFLITKNICL